MKSDRLLAMERYILLSQTASMEALCARFGVSMNTARRDVAELVRRGAVEKVYGGARARRDPESALTPFEKRRLVDAPQKVRIGMRAAELVEDGDVVFLDSGTTTLQTVDFLGARRGVTVVTHNLEAIVRALPNERLQVMALPGQLQRRTNSFTGMEAARALRRYNIRTAFMAATGVCPGGVTNASALEFEIKRSALEHSERAVLLLTSAKFGVAGLMTYADFSQFDAVVTDAPPPPAYAQAIARAGAQLIVADDGAC